MAVFGFTVAGIPIVINAFIAALWQEKSNPVMQSVHFAFSLGMAVAPMVVAKFVPDKPITYQVPSSVNSAQKSFFTDTFEVTVIPPLLPVFLFAGCLLFLSTFVSMWSLVYQRSVRAVNHCESEHESIVSAAENDEECEDTFAKREENKYTHTLMIIAMMIGFTYQACENNSISFVYEFICFTNGHKMRALYITTLLSSSYAAFRFVNIFTARFVPTHIMILGHMCLALVCNLLLLLFTNTSYRSIVALIFISMGIGYSGVFPSLYSYYAQNINMSSQRFAPILMSAAVSCVVVPLVEGPFLRPDTSMIFIYVNLTSLILSLFFFTLFHCVCKRAALSSCHQRVTCINNNSSQ